MVYNGFIRNESSIDPIVISGIWNFLLQPVHTFIIWSQHTSGIQQTCIWKQPTPTKRDIVLALSDSTLNPLTAGAAYFRVFIFYYHIKYHILNMLKIKCDINQQDLKRVYLRFVKSE